MSKNERWLICIDLFCLLIAERVTKLKKMRRSNLATAAVLGASVFAIFGYSMWAVGSEKFLDEFDEKPANKSWKTMKLYKLAVPVIYI